MIDLAEIAFSGYKGFMYSQGNPPDLGTLAIVNGSLEIFRSVLSKGFPVTKNCLKTGYSPKEALLFGSFETIRYLPKNLGYGIFMTSVGFAGGYLTGELLNKFS